MELRTISIEFLGVSKLEVFQNLGRTPLDKLVIRFTRCVSFPFRSYFFVDVR